MKSLLVLFCGVLLVQAWEEDCGYSQYEDAGIDQGADKIDRIVGGWEARENEFPYQVSVQVWGSHYCGGVLIDRQWVLLASHCFFDDDTPDRFTIVLGEHVRTPDGSAHRNNMDVENFFEHEDFVWWSLQNDIALIKMVEPINVNISQWPVCPPDDFHYAQDVCSVSGWGSLYYQGPSQLELRYTNVPVYWDDDCRDAYDEGWILPGMLCAGVLHERDACQGDSGGPLAFKYNGRFELVGIVSWGEDCASSKPGVYTRVGDYVDWIERIQAEN
jgi:secreted trypsin-like serine protease